MSEQNTDILVEKYSATEDHYYEITKNTMEQYDLWVFGYDERMNGYFMKDEYRRLADSLEEATQMGDQILDTLG